MKKMSEWKLYENTLLIFITDNGQAGRAAKKNGKRYRPHTAGLRAGKGSPYEGGTRVPAFWRWKGVLPEGRDIDTLTAHIDIFPTFAEIAGAKIPDGTQNLDGRSLLPLLDGSKASWKERYLFVHKGRWEKGEDPDKHKYENCAVRSERFRLVKNKELYDIEADPSEKTDVADKHPDVVKAMQAAYDKWWAETRPLMVNEDAPYAKEKPFFVLYEKHLNQGSIGQWIPPKL